MRRPLSSSLPAFRSACLAASLMALPLAASHPALNPTDRKQVLDTLQRDIRANCILPEVGEKTVAASW